jgi:hypothetical protein
MDGDYRAAFDQHRIGCAAVPATSLVGARLKEDHVWMVTHADGQWMVFQRQ